MHTMEITIDGTEYAVHHNGDWSGSVDLVGGGLSVSIPAKLFLAIGRNAVLQEVIGRVEDMFVANTTATGCTWSTLCTKTMVTTRTNYAGQHFRLCETHAAEGQQKGMWIP